jgi:hypothetical protein
MKSVTRGISHGEFTPLSNPFETKDEAGKTRLKYPERGRKTIGRRMALTPLLYGRF